MRRLGGIYIVKFDFEWDPAKEQINIRKHGITFSEAQTVFADPLAVIFEDEWHSDLEPRELIFGHSARGHLLSVCYTERTENIVRIISARAVASKERKRYEQSR